MKLIHERFERDGKGSVKCTPETEDDIGMWHNLLKVDDIIHATGDEESESIRDGIFRGERERYLVESY